MGIFTAKQYISGVNCLIRTNEGLEDVAPEYILELLDVLEYEGYMTINGVYYQVYVLPPPPTIHETEQ